VSIRRLLPPHTKQIKIEESIYAGALRLGIQKTHKQKNQNQRIFSREATLESLPMESAVPEERDKASAVPMCGVPHKPQNI
jgi:hypothetical protein